MILATKHNKIYYKGEKIMKKQSNMEMVAEGLTLIEESSRELSTLSARYNDWIDEAARLGEDDYSNQLIEDKVDTDDFRRDLDFLMLQIRSGAITAKTFNNLKKIPGAIKACGVLLKAGPDFTKLGRDITKFKKGLNNAKSSLRGLRAEISKDRECNLSIDERVVGARPEVSERVKAEQAARELRLMRSASSGASITVPEQAIEADSVDIDAIIDAENGRRKP